MFHRYFNLRTALTVFVFMLLFSTSSPADPMYYNYEDVGSANTFPFGQSDGKSVNWLFPPGDFTQPTPFPAGNKITDVYFFLSSDGGGSRTYTDLTIKMAQDDIITLTSGQFYPGPWDTVYYNASVTLSGTNSTWLGPITLDTPYLYNPARSLILCVEQSGSTGSGIYVDHFYSSYVGLTRVWSVGGPPFTPYNSGDRSVVNLGFDVAAVPLPGAAILGALGLSFAGWRLRRKENN